MVHLLPNVHAQGVTGLSWHPDSRCLASGGNENTVRIWDARTHTTRLEFAGHKAAVKAMSWSPLKREVLATGGGTKDRTIQSWNTNSGKVLHCVTTQGQVGSLHWNYTELISCHGYSNNVVNIWDSCLTKIQGLHGHKNRIISSAMSPDFTTLVTASADETLRFWKINESSVLPEKPTQMPTFGRCIR